MSPQDFSIGFLPCRTLPVWSACWLGHEFVWDTTPEPCPTYPKLGCAEWRSVSMPFRFQKPLQQYDRLVTAPRLRHIIIVHSFVLLTLSLNAEVSP